MDFKPTCTRSNTYCLVLFFSTFEQNLLYIIIKLILGSFKYLSVFMLENTVTIDTR